MIIPEVAAPGEDPIWLGSVVAARAAHERVLQLRPQLERMTARRNESIREAVANGAQVGRLAPFLGLTRQSVYGVLAR